MKSSDVNSIRFHEDAAYFGEALEFTSAVTGFPARLIEKDYLCTILLQYLTKVEANLIFKGGTCIAKVYTDFYRLSEDLDFAIPMPVDSTRGKRRNRAKAIKGIEKQIIELYPGLLTVEPFKGANESSQYAAILGYPSFLGRTKETIKIEVGLREPLLIPTLLAEVRTLLLDPVNELPLVPLLSVNCLSWEEALAEKMRAALSRREVAIRDYYDIDHAINNLNFPVLEPRFLELVQKKMSVPGNESVDVSSDRLESLRLQVDAELKPVLRPQDFSKFDLNRAFEEVAEVAVELERH